MNIAGKYIENKLVEGINLDQIVTFQFNEEKGALTLQLAGADKDKIVTGIEAEGLYHLLNRSVSHNLTAKPYDWRAEMKKNRSQAEAELAAQEKAEQEKLKQNGTRTPGVPGAPASISTLGLGGAKPAVKVK